MSDSRDSCRVVHVLTYSRFFYADERHEDGKIKGMQLDGEAHGDFFAELATHEGKVPWDATFVKGKGYVPLN